jgi:hypothetical protein
MTFDQCVSRLIGVAKSDATKDESITQTDSILQEYLASSSFDALRQRGRLAKALGDNAPDPSLTLLPLMQAHIARC